MKEKKKAANSPKKNRQVKEAYRLPLGLLYDGYTYELRRSPRRRTLAIRVSKKREIVVYAPTRASENMIRDFVLSRTDWIGHAVAVTEARLTAHPEPTREEMAALRRAARERLPERVAYYSQLTGLRPTGFRISSAKTRFGSCNQKGALSFSCLLMRYPERAIDYVVLHEICHIAYMNHSPNFYGLIATYMPDYKEREALLRR